ncbi:MAG TPA: MIP/aquaporin family protein [Micromonosporaceae bacterium]
MEAAIVRRLIGEAVGTLLLVLFGAGSVVAALTVSGGKPIDYPSLGMISLTFGLVIALVIYAFGTLSGAHINPVVTVGLASVGRFPWVEVIPYIIAQAVGAFGGGLLIMAAFGTRAADFGTGGTKLSPDVSWAQGITAEAIGTFLLVLAIMALAVDRRAPSGWAGLMIGLAVTTGILMVGPVTGGSFNPARTFGPYLATAVFGGSVTWADFPVYLIGPLIGSIVAVAAYELVARPERPLAAVEGTQGVVRGRKVPVPGEAQRPHPSRG